MNVWTFQPPSWWPALFMVPVMYALGVLWRRRAQRSLVADFGRRERALLGEPSYVWSREVLALAALATLTVALLRPVAPGREAQLAPDVVLCVDVSRSMGAEDERPTRFTAMRRQAHGLLASAIGSRFALVAFAGDAQVVAPVTGDRRAVAWLLDELEPGATGQGGTDLAAAIRAAAQSLARVGSGGEILLLTDGEDFGEEAAQAASVALADGHRVHCVGFGTSGGSRIVIEDLDGEQSFLLDKSGEEVVSRLDVDALGRVAASGGGALLRCDQGDALAVYWRDELLPFSARRRMAAGEEDVVQRFWWPLLGGVLLWMLRMCLPERTR